ncbi:MAG: hypothetical protein JO121_02465 [Deltaproteobacteria bacterium]|nr:hypothetical protein [Deltaproteobacteria bacterium]
MAWQVKYFKREDGTVPAHAFQEGLPKKLRAKLLKFTKEAADSEGKLGGGYYEVCHSRPGISETRAKLGKDLARFLCGRDGDRLVILTGVLKGIDEPTPDASFDGAEAFLAEYNKTKSVA